MELGKWIRLAGDRAAVRRAAVAAALDLLGRALVGNASQPD